MLVHGCRINILPVRSMRSVRSPETAGGKVPRRHVELYDTIMETHGVYIAEWRH